MSVLPRRGDVRFNGEPTIYFMTLCRKCDMALPHTDEETQRRWASEHSDAEYGPGHEVMLAVDVRPVVGSVPVMRRQ